MSSIAQAMTVLGQPAHDYVKVCVAAGKSLVAQQMPLLSEGGYVWAFMPAALSGAQLANPEWSLSSAITNYAGKGDSDVLLRQFIMHYLRGGPGRYAIFQDWNGKPDDNVLMESLHTEWQNRYFTFGSEVYHFIDSADTNLDVESITDIMRRGSAANSRLNAGILTAANGVSAIIRGQEITPHTMKALSQGVEHVLVEGFDGDREIIWSRNAPVPAWQTKEVR